MAAKTTTEHDVEVLTLEEGTEMFDRQARERLGISGEDFVRRLQAHELADLDDTHHADVFDLTLMLPFAGYGLDGKRLP